MNYQELKQKVLGYNYKYYDLAISEISDQEYDKLYDLLVETEKKQGFKDWDSPTQRVGHSRGNVKHPFKLWSLEKTYNQSDIDSRFTVKTKKLDGACINVIFNKGNFIRVLSRGDGEHGEDLTHLFKDTYKDKKIGYLGTISFIGECVYFGEVDNYRNYVAGALNLKNVDEFKSRNIDFVVHDTLGIKLPYLERLQFAKECGFYTVLDEIIIKNIPSDGWVYRTNNPSLEEELGYTSKYPKFAIALKSAETVTAVTMLKNVVWNIGRTGTVNPTGIVEPILIGTATVSRLTLHNIAFIEENDICLGDRIEIERAGEIIPKYLRTVEKSPVRVKITQKEAEESVGTAVKRVGPKLFSADNSVNKEKEILNFVKQMDIQGLGPASINKLGLTSIPEIYRITNWNLLGANGQKVAQEIEYSKTKPYEKVLAGLGIPNVGLSLAKKIISKIPKFKDLPSLEYEKIDKIGPIIRDKILAWYEENYEWVLKLPVQLEAKEEELEFLDNTSIRKICITGKMDRTRDELSTILEGKGFEMQKMVTKDTYALITDGKDSSKKTELAEKYNIRIVNYFDNKQAVLAGIF